MSLLPPVVVAPVSECNRSIRVKGQITGAKVRVFADGALVAEGVATWPDEAYPLLVGAVLKLGQHLTATQDDGGGASPPTPEPFIRVQRGGGSGSLVFKALPRACGQAVWITGAVPGATVTVKEGAAVLGSADAPSGEARVFLAPGVSPAGVLLASQQACGVKSGDTPAPPADATPAALPAPKVVEPLRECQRSIRVSNVLVGARVTIERSTGLTHSSYFDYPDLTFIQLPPLKKGETVTAYQEFTGCRDVNPKSLPSKPVAALPNVPTPSPVILGPLCKGGTGVKLGNLIPGARIRILSDGAEVGQAEAPSAVFAFRVPPLKGGAKITAEQELCGNWSPPSNAVLVNALAHDLIEPVIVGPLVECGGMVRVKAAPGSWVIINSAIYGDIGSDFASEGEIDIAVSPLLANRDNIVPGSSGCGHNTSGKSVNVGPAPQMLKPPGVGKVTQMMTAVPVTGVVPGAMVDVFVNGVPQGSAFCSTSAGEIAIVDALQIDDKVTARQRLCTLASLPTSPAVVVMAPPVASFTASPTSGEAPLAVKFTNTSSGPITSYAWDFQNNGSTDSVVKDPSFTYSGAGSYTAKLTVDGPGGTSVASASIAVSAPVVGFDQIVIYNCNTSRRDIIVWTRDATAGGAWVSHGALANQYDGSGSCPAAGAPKVVALTDKHAYEVVCVDTGLFGCPGDDPTQLACRRFYAGGIVGKKGGGTLPITVS